MAIYKSILPSGYKQLANIKSSGTQYINTGINAYGTFVIDCSFESSTGRTLIGFSTNAGNYFEKNADNKLAMGGNNVVNVDITKRKIITFTRTSNSATVSCDGLSTTRTPQEESLQTFTFKVMGAGLSTGTTYNGGMTLYGLKYYNTSNELVANFVPALRTSDNVIGIYDTIGNTFSINGGTDTLISGGNNKANNIIKNSKFACCVLKGQVPYFNWLPSEYQQVEYIYKTGGVAYIDTGIKGNLNTKAEIKFKYDTLPSSTSIIAGARGVSSTTNAFVMGVTSGHEYYSRFGNGTPQENRQAYDTDIHTMTNSVDGGYLDDIKIATYPTQSSYETPYPVALFASRENDGTITFNALYCRIYYYKVWESNKVVQYLIPCYRKSDNVYGMYDIISRQFLTNANTSGSFTGGHPIYYSLPSTYQRVEYLKSTGTQYIDTGIVPTDTFGCSVDISYPELPSSAVAEFGCRQDTSSTRCFWVVGTTGKSYVGWNGTYPASDALRPDTTPNTWYNIKLNYMNDRTFKQDNETISTDLSTLSSSIAKNFLFFACNNQTSSPTSPLNITKRENSVKQAIITNGTEIVMKLIPCMRKSDGELGMFDLISGAFLTNQGTGTFERGRIIVGNDEFQEVEYIEGDGDSWIDTGITPTQDYSMELKFQLTELLQDTGQIVAGTRENASSKCFLFGKGSTNNLYFRLSNVQQTTVGSPITGDLNPHIASLSKNGGYIDSVLYATFTNPSNFIGVAPITLLKCNAYSSGVLTDPVKARIYYCKIWDESALTRDFVPCYHKADNVIGLYDTVNGVFYTNQGTGTFTKGNDVV